MDRSITKEFYSKLENLGLISRDCRLGEFADQLRDDREFARTLASRVREKWRERALGISAECLTSLGLGDQRQIDRFFNDQNDTIDLNESIVFCCRLLSIISVYCNGSKTSDNSILNESSIHSKFLRNLDTTRLTEYVDEYKLDNVRSMYGKPEIAVAPSESLSSEKTEESRLTVLIDECRDLSSAIERDNYRDRPIPDNRFDLSDETLVGARDSLQRSLDLLEAVQSIGRVASDVNQFLNYRSYNRSGSMNSDFCNDDDDEWILTKKVVSQLMKKLNQDE